MTSKNNVNTKLPMNSVGKNPVLLGKKVLFDMNKGVLKPYVKPGPPSILVRNEPRRILPKNLIIDRRQSLNTGQNIHNVMMNKNRSRRVPGNSSITQQETINQQTPDSLSNVVVIDLRNTGDMMNFNNNVHLTEESNIPQVVGFENANKELCVIKKKTEPNRSVLKRSLIRTVWAEENTVQEQTEKVIKRHFDLKGPYIITKNTILPSTSSSNIIDSNSRKHKISHDSHFENKRRLINSELNEGNHIIMGNQVKDALINQPTFTRCETFTNSSISNMLNANEKEYYNPQVNVYSPEVPENLRNIIGYIAVKAFKQSVQIDINGNIPLQTAIIEEDKSSFLQQYVVIKYTNPKTFNHQNHSSETALFLAVKYENEEGVALLLRCGADQTIYDNCGNTPLHVAARDGLLNCCKLLLKADGADRVKNKLNDEGLTPLHIATIFGHYNIVRLLTYENVDINMKDSKCGRTAYNLALYHGKDSIANLLMNLNCITTDHDYAGHLPIHEKVTQPKSNDSNIDLLIGCVINTKSVPNKDKSGIHGKKQMVSTRKKLFSGVNNADKITPCTTSSTKAQDLNINELNFEPVVKRVGDANATLNEVVGNSPTRFLVTEQSDSATCYTQSLDVNYTDEVRQYTVEEEVGNISVSETQRQDSDEIGCLSSASLQEEMVSPSHNKEHSHSSDINSGDGITAELPEVINRAQNDCLVTQVSNNTNHLKLKDSRVVLPGLNPRDFENYDSFTNVNCNDVIFGNNVKKSCCSNVDKHKILSIDGTDYCNYCNFFLKKENLADEDNLKPEVKFSTISTRRTKFHRNRLKKNEDSTSITHGITKDNSNDGVVKKWKEQQLRQEHENNYTDDVSESSNVRKNKNREPVESVSCVQKELDMMLNLAEKSMRDFLDYNQVF